jgi:hypothetical protein
MTRQAPRAFLGAPLCLICERSVVPSHLFPIAHTHAKQIRQAAIRKRSVSASEQCSGVANAPALLLGKSEMAGKSRQAGGIILAMAQSHRQALCFQVGCDLA